MTQTQRGKNRPDIDVPGGDADRPSDIPRAGWFQIAKRGWAEAKADQVPLLAAGLAYYAFLAIFPALVAAVSMYALLADPAQIADQASHLLETLPAEARDLIIENCEARVHDRSAWASAPPSRF